MTTFYRKNRIIIVSMKKKDTLQNVRINNETNVNISNILLFDLRSIMTKFSNLSITIALVCVLCVSGAFSFGYTFK